jgi:hypothetical protein
VLLEDREWFMSIRITVDVFSGRPDPSVELDDRQSAEILDRLMPVRRLGDDEASLPPESALGYRGLVIEQIGDRRAELPDRFRVVGGDVFGRGLAHRVRDDRVEEYLLGPESPLRHAGVDAAVLDQLPDLAERFREIRRSWPVPFPPVPFWPPGCRCGPVYEPGWWNVPSRQPSNNCYNYATNYRTDTFAQPGRAAGAMYSSLTCGSVGPAAVADDLIDTPAADNACPTLGHLVALVIWPGVDFHWYRKGRNGWWSHKPGSTPVTNVDNSGHYIFDPRNANRGPYTDFCTFMVVMHGHIKIN